jgi:poly(3-hydroxyalkanoate) synthetase
MSWQHSQAFAQGNRTAAARPLPAMTAAALLASQKSTAEAALQQLQEGLRSQLASIPNDIDWLAFQAGVAKYSSAPQPAARPGYPVLATAGRVSLRDAGGEGPPVVLVPSMVNRGYILDLGEGYSLVEYLREQGHRVLLVDWGDPTSSADAPLTLNDIVQHRLEPLVQAAAQQAKQAVAVVGYCMGGLLAVAAAVRLGQAVVAKLAVAAMPWDFTHTASHAHMQATTQWLRPLLQAAPTLAPAPMAQYFWSLDPWGPLRRIMAYGKETDPTRLEHLTRLEDWLADGLALDSPVAQEMLLGWYAENTAFKGQWVVGGTPILPQNLTMPLHITLTQTDILVPLNASLPFVGQTKGATVQMAQTGHVSLVAGRRAKSQFYEPLGWWLTKD